MEYQTEVPDNPFVSDHRKCLKCGREIEYIIPLPKDISRPCPDCYSGTEFLGYTERG